MRVTALMLLVQTAYLFAATTSPEPIGPIVQRTHETSPSQAPVQVSNSVSARSAPSSSNPGTVTSFGAPNGLTIVATFDSTITSDVNSATIQATINSAIAVYEECFATPITVNITFKEIGTGLGQSNTFITSVSYSAFRAALASHATTGDDTTALAHIASGASDPKTGFSTVFLTLPNARALGFTANPPGGTDGTISLNTSICNLSASPTDPTKFSLFAVVSHEIDEVLGTLSNVGQSGVGQAFPSEIAPVDLFRYDVNGARSFTTSSGAICFFSIDGTTDLAQYNQNAGGDFGDWFSPGTQVPQVQDAFGTPGSTPVLGVELRVLDVVGYARNYPIISPAALPQGAAGVAYNQTLTVSNCTPPFTTFSVTGFNAGTTGLSAPAADSTAGTFTVAGTPSAGTATFTVNVTDTFGASTTQSYSIIVNNPLPTLSSISPSIAVAGGASFTLTLTGTNFVSSSVVQWSGQANLIPSAQTATQLTVTVPASYIAAIGAPGITVFNPSPGGGASGNQTFTIVAVLQFNSGPAATPNPAGVGQTIQYAAGANLAGSAFVWAFGDGSSDTGSGATTSHAYTSAGVFTVTVTVTNGAQSTTGAVTVTVNGPIIGTGPNSNGSGFSDAFIAAFGSAPFSLTGITPQPLAGAKLAVKLNFSIQSSDSLTLSGVLPIPAGFTVAGTKLGFALGSLAPVFILNARGQAKSGNDQATVSIKSKKGVVAAQNAKFTIKLSKDSLAAGLATFGLTNDPAKLKPVSFTGAVVFAGAVSSINLSEHYTSKPNKSGMTSK